MRVACLQKKVNAGQWVGLVLGAVAGIAAAVAATCIVVHWGVRRMRMRGEVAQTGGYPQHGFPGPPAQPPPELPRKKPPPAGYGDDGDALSQLYAKKLVRSPPVRGGAVPVAWSCNPLADEAGDGEAAAPPHGGTDEELVSLPAWRPLHQGRDLPR